MIKFVVILFLFIILVSVARAAVTIVGKLLSGFLQQDSSPSSASSRELPSSELKRDPVCGVYVPTATSIKRTIGGETLYFCSNECSAKYRPAKS